MQDEKVEKKNVAPLHYEEEEYLLSSFGVMIIFLKKKVQKIFHSIGPGFITGASDDDPSGIATYAQTGALFGYQQLWTALFAFPFMTFIQEMCGRIGLVTGRGLAQVIRENYSKKLLIILVGLLVVANTINVGADLGAMSSATQLLLGGPFIFWLLVITFVSISTQILVPYHSYARILKYLAISLFAYVISAFAVKQDWRQVGIATVVPYISFSKEYLMNIVAILGTTISPYLFFWQADEEVEEEVEHHRLKEAGFGRPILRKGDIAQLRADTLIGMLFSQLVMFFIIITTAATLHVQGITDVTTADQAARALQPIAGQFTFLIFALGIIGTGFLAVPILAGSAAYALGEACKIKVGLGKTFKQAPVFYGIIAGLVLLGMCVNFLPIPPFKLLYYTAIINGLIAPPLLMMILVISNNRKIMGKHVNNLWSNMAGVIITGVMTVAGLAVVISIFI